MGMGLLLIVATFTWGAGQGWAQPDYTKPNYAYSPPLHKFVNRLPGLGPTKANNLGQYIPIAVPDTATFLGSDYYEIGLRDYTQKMHTDLPATKLRGYYQKNVPLPQQVSQYLGPLILATKNRPVRVKFTNELGTGAAGNLFIPVDKTVMGAGYGPRGRSRGYYPENRAVIHLHGGVPPWISDGTAHQWITPTGEPSIYKKGLDVVNVPDMPNPGAGSQTYYWTNQQSGRLMFYHDHAYGITRLNVYAGEAAGYLVVDPAEEDALKAANVPGTVGTTPDLAHLIPLVIQDKTFVADATTPTQTDPLRYTAVTDPLWDPVKWGAGGSLWFPHVYQPNQTGAGGGMNPLGRWDYGPWMWPPIPNLEPLPHPSIVPEAFVDTPVINGTAYPYANVQPRAYRLRILNACNDRHLNLQFYVANPNNLKEVRMVPANGRVFVVNAQNVKVPFDGRAGGVPDPRTAGPQMIQIGTEGGLLPAVATLPNRPVDFDYDRKSMTLGSVRNFPLPPDYPEVGYTLLLGPAERADVIVDFSAFPGQRLILYNDAPTPMPLFDPRYDFYTGNPDFTANGGAPSTKAGWGPNTRTIMQFRVANTAPVPFNPGPLQAALPGIFAASQAPPLVPLGVYGDNTLYGGIINQGINWDPFLWQGVTFSGYRVFSKSISEDFDTVYGRMNARLGTERSSIDTQGQQTLGIDFIQPATEVVTEVPNDPFGTQIWMIVHNGVDTHPIHFHLLNVQVINRVDWAGVVKPPDPNELGWKETVRMNMLESVIVAVRPKKPAAPFIVPTSVRPLDVTMMPTGPLGSAYNAALNPNPLFDYDWQYVWHCHILGHEENDMMRPLVLVTVPFKPTQPVASQPVVGTASVEFSFKDKSKNEEGFTVQRATDAAFTNPVAFQVNAANGNAANMNGYINSTVTFTDGTVTLGSKYWYRVQASNQSGGSPWATAAAITVN
jgi:FtsP/CotA-like multicopper oxidase with cupredoxin domain